MRYIRGLESFQENGRCAVTLGKFDGVHRGHQKLVDQVKEFGEKDGIISVVCAFDMVPMWEKKQMKPQLIMTKEERYRHLEGQVDYLVECPFTEEFSQIEAEDFIKDVIFKRFHAAYVVVGTDFHFGHGKRGDIHMLEAYAKQYDYELIAMEKERYEDRIISSTFVKEALREGDMPLVSNLLGYHYGTAGIVEHGRQLGRTLGFPTFNVAPDKKKIMPPKGVYADRVYVDGKWYNGIANIGVKPTVSNENRMLIESYLFDYSGNAYGKEVLIELLAYRRPEQKFSNVDEMKACIEKDIAFGKHYFRGE